MIISVVSKRIYTPIASSRSRSKFFLSSIQSSLSPTIQLAGSRCAHFQSSQQTCNERSSGETFWGMASVAASATAGMALLGISSSPLQTLCDENLDKDLEAEPEIDPYENLPEQDEPTNCSICLTYRKGPCRPYWRKVEACTKDGEKERSKKEGEGTVSEGDNKNKSDDNDDDSSPMSESSTRCFKYMMPWIDCASKYRNLYTLIEMDTNYTEGIQELEATSRHFCWAPGHEPTVDWSNWQQSGTEEETVVKSDSFKSSVTGDANDLVSNVPLWKIVDTFHGDVKLITIEAKVSATINSGEGILECAYALDQDNNVIGFAYGTKPSDLISDEIEEVNADESAETIKGDDVEKQETERNGDTTSESGSKDKTIALNVHLLPSQTQNFVLAASYTHRVERAKSSNEDGKKPIALESHLYKSKPFVLADIPKVSSQDSP